MEVGLNLGIISGVLDPLLDYKNFLDNLCQNNKGIPCKYIYIYTYNEIVIIKQTVRAN